MIDTSTWKRDGGGFVVCPIGAFQSFGSERGVFLRLEFVRNAQQLADETPEAEQFVLTLEQAGALAEMLTTQAEKLRALASSATRLN
ncbi:MAG: hypothetical protein ABL957_06545 [Parvularculaceae bacterium]